MVLVLVLLLLVHVTTQQLCSRCAAVVEECWLITRMHAMHQFCCLQPHTWFATVHQRCYCSATIAQAPWLCAVGTTKATAAAAAAQICDLIGHQPGHYVPESQAKAALGYVGSAAAHRQWRRCCCFIAADMRVPLTAPSGP